MSAIENPNAFPFSAEYGHPAACGGMTLRDWFAGQALAAVIAMAAARQLGGNADDSFGERVSRNAYEYADAMLAERAKAGAA